MDEYSYINILFNSFIAAFVMALYPFGLEFFINFLSGDRHRRSRQEFVILLGCYLIFVIFFAILNTFRLFYYNCHPNCVFIPGMVEFKHCCKRY
ncbi:MAG: hypothetical protein ACW98D_19780 [Promethearchaeota archaeon]|jgi:integral membrane sensor domain MASE1